MAYQVIARKFRPQDFAELVGQKHVTRTLLNAMAADRFPHAILFNGPRGTGKTTSARIVAKTLLCANLRDHLPCQTCKNCEDVTAGRHLDVMEIDGASNNSVDDIRDLRDSVGYMPTSGKHKVYIIDEVHMLSTSAFNALLKTLEEPPAHVIFIFATTEIQKIPATILSRCQRFDFHTLPLQNIQDHLHKICQAEGIQADPTALWLIAKNAKGSVRDGLTLLDQVISFGGQQLTSQIVMDVLGLTDRELLFRGFKAIAEQNKAQLLAVTQGVLGSGYDPLLFLEEFMEILRHALLVRMGIHQQLEIPAAEVQELATIVASLAEPEIHLLFDVCLSGAQAVSASRDPALAFEMLLFKMLYAPRLLATASPELPVSSPQIQSAPSISAPSISAPSISAPSISAPSISAPSISAPSVPVACNKDMLWEDFVVEVKKSNGFLGALLEHTSIYREDERTLTLGLPGKMAFLQSKLQEEKNMERTRKFLLSIKGDNRDIAVELLAKKEAEKVLSPKAKAEKAIQEKEQHEQNSISSHPLVKATEEIFRGQIVSIQES